MALATAAPAGAVTIGAPDLAAEPDAPATQCASQACTVFWQMPGAGPVRAPADGWITEVRFRTPDEGLQAATLHLLKPNLLFELQFEKAIPLEGLTPPAPLAPPIYTAKTKIPVVETEIVALELQGSAPVVHNLLDSYAQPGGQVEIFDPAPGQGESASPGEFLPEAIPAVQFEFEMVKPPPLPEKEGDEEQPPPPPPPSADVAVTKSFSGELGIAQIGGAAPFYVLVENKGPNTAQGVVLKDSFGRGLTLKRTAVLKGSAGKPNCGGGGGRKGGTVTCNLGALAPGAKVGIDFFFVATGKSSKGAGKGAKRREKNVAVVSSAGPPDPNPKNNRAVASAKVESGGAPCPARSRVGTPRGDKLKGTRRAETILGLDGNDRIQGKRGRDCLFGGDGGDVLIGGPQADLIEGGPGNDFVRAADGSRDKINRGRGRRDRVVADRRLDRVARNCERVRRR